MYTGDLFYHDWVALVANIGPTYAWHIAEVAMDQWMFVKNTTLTRR